MQKYYECRKCSKLQTSHGPILVKNCNECSGSLCVLNRAEYLQRKDN